MEYRIKYLLCKKLLAESNKIYTAANGLINNKTISELPTMSVIFKIFSAILEWRVVSCELLRQRHAILCA